MLRFPADADGPRMPTDLRRLPDSALLVHLASCLAADYGKGHPSRPRRAPLAFAAARASGKSQVRATPGSLPWGLTGGRPWGPKPLQPLGPRLKQLGRSVVAE